MTGIGSSRYGHRGSRRGGVTLLEIVLSMGILVVVTSMTYWFYSSSLETSRKGTEAAQRLRLVRSLLDRMALEIRQASAITADGRVGVRGAAEQIFLSSYRVPTRELSKELPTAAPPPPGEYDLTKVEYKIARHPDILDPDDNFPLALGVARTEVLIPRPDTSASSAKSRTRAGEEDESDNENDNSDNENDNQGGEEDSGDTGTPPLPFDGLSDEEKRMQGEAGLDPQVNWEELYAPEIRYLRFCYYDGKSWWDTWDVGGNSPLPQLVQVTLGFRGCRPFGDTGGQDEINEEFCTCMNQDPVDCVPLAPDQYSIVVRVPQADPLFRSRVSRETKGLMDTMAAGQRQEQEAAP